MLITKTIKTTIFTFLLFIAMGTGVFYLWSNIKNSGVELVTTLTDVRDEDQLLLEYHKLSDELASTAKERERLATYVLSSESDTVSLLSLFDQVAEEFGVELSTKKLDVITTKEKKFDDLSVSLNIAGREASVLAMLELLENLPYHSNITNLRLERSKLNDVNQAILSLDMIIGIKEQL